MGSLNRIELIGNLGKQPDVKTLDNGNKVATFTLATTEPAYTTQQGKQVAERTEWHNIVAWGGCASIAERFLSKGQQVYVEGKVCYRTYEDKNTHQKRYVTEVVCERIVLLSTGSKRDNASQQGDTAPTTQQGYGEQPNYQQAQQMPTGASYGGYAAPAPMAGNEELPF
jgi:single-strand DNA-binding protein